MIDLQGIKVTLVESMTEAEEFLTWVGQRRPILAIDTETTGLKWWTTNFCRLVQFGDGERAYALGVKEWWQIIADAMDRIVDNGARIAMHNAKFDMHALTVSGFTVPDWHNIYDTMLMDHLCYPIRSHKLKVMGKRVYGGWATVGDQLLKHYNDNHGTDWATVPVTEPSYWAYGCMDTVLTSRFAMSLGREMSGRGLMTPFHRESAVQSIAYRAECRGLRINTEYAELLLEQWTDEIVALRIQLDAWGVDNPGSKMQVVAALAARENWDPEAFTETGEPQLTKSILSAMDSRIAPLVLRYRRLVKWSGTYLDYFLGEQINGVVHPNINTMAARTGRMSITNPPMQTLPAGEASIRHCILPPEGDWLWPVDYDGQELRVMASLAGDEGLIGLFNEGLDPHSFVASVVYGLDYKELESGQHKTQRKTAKNTQYSRIYGASDAKSAETAGVPVNQIVQFKQIYDLRFPGVQRYMDAVIKEARMRMLHEGEPYITSAGGRWLNVEPDKLYALVNYKIQGDCADVLKEKTVLLDKAGFGDNIMLWVHDEILFSFPEGDTESVKEAALIMEEAERYRVPLTVGATGPFNSWGQHYE